MAIHRSLLVGCGARATEHAEVYRDIPNMQLTACWDRQQWQGQRDFTAAVADWLDSAKPHLNRWAVAKAGFSALIGAQQSIYEGRRVEFPQSFTDAQWRRLRARLRKIGPAT